MKNTWNRWLLLLLMASCLMLAGCGRNAESKNDMKNVEERDYATILIISEGTEDKPYRFDVGIAQEKRVGEESQIEELSGWDGKDFHELAREYRSVKGKDLSLSHLKAILLSFEQMSFRVPETEELFFLLDGNEEVTKTCPVLWLEGKEEFLQYLEEAEEPVGNYLEQIIRTGEDAGQSTPWLKDYLKAIREGQELPVSFLVPVAEGYQVSGEAVQEGVTK